MEGPKPGYAPVITRCLRCGNPSTEFLERGAWDFESGLYVWQDGTICLPLKLAELFEILWQRFGRPIATDDIAPKYAGSHDSSINDVLNTLHVQKSKLEARLLDSGAPVGIVVVKSRGYALAHRESLLFHACRNERLTPGKISEIRDLWLTGRHSQAEIGRRFNITRQRVCQIVNEQKKGGGPGEETAAHDVPRDA